VFEDLNRSQSLAGGSRPHPLGRLLTLGHALPDLASRLDKQILRAASLIRRETSSEEAFVARLQGACDDLPCRRARDRLTDRATDRSSSKRPRDVTRMPP